MNDDRYDYWLSFRGAVRAFFISVALAALTLFAGLVFKLSDDEAGEVIVGAAGLWPMAFFAGFPAAWLYWKLTLRLRLAALRGEEDAARRFELLRLGIGGAGAALFAHLSHDQVPAVVTTAFLVVACVALAWPLGRYRAGREPRSGADTGLEVGSQQAETAP